MDVYNLWSLRLGFSGKQAQLIEKQGIHAFLKHSFEAPLSVAHPDLMKNELKVPEEINKYRENIKKTQADGSKQIQMQLDKKAFDIRAWWIGNMMDNTYPLREKMTLFWHNHYVSTLKKVLVNYWLFDHNEIIRENAFGNFRELTKKILYTNAMVKYLDNTDNKNNKFNENLSRELLELFTLGIGNYTENDIKEGAKALAGLSLGEEGAVYQKKFEYNGEVNFMGKKGNLKANDIVDIIFEQKNAPYFITQKILKWFIYDNPPQELVTYYGDYLREANYEIQPLLVKIFTEEFYKPTAGSKIKDPLVFMIQLHHELKITNQSKKVIAVFIRDQGMDLYNQLNVKGWQGGQAWITAQIIIQRNNMANMLCKGYNMPHWRLNNLEDETDIYNERLSPVPEWSHENDNKKIIEKMADRLLFMTDVNLQKNFEKIITHDFDPDAEEAKNSIMRLFNAMVTTPEFQII